MMLSLTAWISSNSQSKTKPNFKRHFEAYFPWKFQWGLGAEHRPSSAPNKWWNAPGKFLKKRLLPSGARQADGVRPQEYNAACPQKPLGPDVLVREELTFVQRQMVKWIIFCKDLEMLIDVYEESSTQSLKLVRTTEIIKVKFD